MPFSSKVFFASAALAALHGCSHEGAGSGTLEKPVANTSSGSEATGKIDFTWESGADASKGSIAAVSTDGRTFEGSFLQPTNTITASDYGRIGTRGRVIPGARGLGTTAPRTSSSEATAAERSPT